MFISSMAKETETENGSQVSLTANFIAKHARKIPTLTPFILMITIMNLKFKAQIYTKLDIQY